MKFRVAFFCHLVLLIGAAAGFHVWNAWHRPAGTGILSQAVIVEEGMTARAIARKLAETRVVSDETYFYAFCVITGNAHKLQAGEYRLSPFFTPAQILDHLTRGRIVTHRVTFPEGSTVHDVARILAEAGLARRERVLELAGDRAFLDSLEIDAPSLEGYLFPDTYTFRKSQAEESILRRMVQTFRKNFPEALRDHAAQRGLTVHDTVILASLVEKEAMVDEERPLIAAVFFNRLLKDMPLQSDPTAVYDIPGFNGPITRHHLERETPYNTYTRTGLPAGPICNPGKKSLEAVLNPADVPYLYFVSNNDGTHSFSVSYSEHLRAVKQYRERLGASSGDSEGS